MMSRGIAQLGRLAGLLIAAVIVVTGCSSGSGEDPAANGGSTSRPADVNDSDTAFAQAMLAHHQKAVEMATLAAERSQDPRVRELAGRIEATGQADSATLTAWLSEWGAAPAAPAPAGAATADLSALSGQAFDQAFVEQMIEHRTGAITAAETEVADGQDPGAREMAAAIASGYPNEVIEMAQLRIDLGG
jgi:uncharacterized protein (DUF305 family)